MPLHWENWIKLLPWICSSLLWAIREPLRRPAKWQLSLWSECVCVWRGVGGCFHIFCQRRLGIKDNARIFDRVLWENGTATGVQRCSDKQASCSLTFEFHFYLCWNSLLLFCVFAVLTNFLTFTVAARDIAAKEILIVSLGVGLPQFTLGSS